MSESSYKSLIENKSQKNIVYSHYNDFESNGYCEMFAIVGDLYDDSIYGEIWYCDQNGTYKIEDTQGYHLNPKTYLLDKNIFIAFEEYFATGSITHLWSVKGGKPYQPQLTDKGNGIGINNYNEVELVHSAYDAMMLLDDDWKSRPTDEEWTGHTYKPYYYYWNGENFREYGAIEIDKNDLLTIEGTSELLEYISELNGTINEIYYRANNVIQINYQIEEHDNNYKQTVTNYGYISFRYIGKKITLEDCNIDAGNYAKALNPSIAEYPEEFKIN